MKRGLLLIAFLLFAPMAWAAEVVPLTWPTRFAAPPPKFGSDADALLPMFRIALVLRRASEVVTPLLRAKLYLFPSGAPRQTTAETSLRTP